MSDFVRIFLITVCMLLCFRLGEEYAARKAFNAVMEGVKQAMKEFHDVISKMEPPKPNETINSVGPD